MVYASTCVSVCLSTCVRLCVHESWILCMLIHAYKMHLHLISFNIFLCYLLMVSIIRIRVCMYVYYAQDPTSVNSKGPRGV